MSSSIPQIDFSPFLEGRETGKKQVASQIGKACREIGFFTLTDHGVSLELIQRVFDANREFHQQPLEEKEQELESNKSIVEVFDEFEQGEVWRVDILEDNVKINPKPIYDYSKVKEVE